MSELVYKTEMKTKKLKKVLFMALKINRARNERWWSDGQGYFTKLYFRKTIQILNYDANDALKNTTDIDLSQSRLRMRHDYVGQRLVIKA